MSAPDSTFEIRRQADGVPPQSAVMPTPSGVTSLPRGTAIALDTDGTFVPCNVGKPFFGFLKREINTTGPALADHVFGFAGGGMPRLELSDKFGGATSVEGAIEVEAEGTNYLVFSTDGTNTGFITTATAPGVGLNFFNGKFRVVQGSERAEFVLAQQLTPTNDGFARIRAVRQGGY